MGEESIADMAKETFQNLAKEGIEELGSAMGMAPEMPMDQKPFKMPTKDELLAMLDTMGLSEQETEELRAALMDDGSGAGYPVQSSWTSEAFILIAFLILIASIFAFMFHRIHKSFADKEKKQEEKRQKKLLKKRR